MLPSSQPFLTKSADVEGEWEKEEGGGGGEGRRGEGGEDMGSGGRVVGVVIVFPVFSCYARPCG